MDLICDRIIQRLREDRHRDMVRVSLGFTAATGYGTFPEASDSAVRFQHEVEFWPTYPCDGGDGGYVIAVRGVRFRPNRDLVRTLVRAWLEEIVGAACGEGGDARKRVACRVDIDAATSDARSVYHSCVRFEYAGAHARNKRAVNRVVETVMRIKGMCESMAGE
eukprot:jgi/Tetstr1/453983/TSEL_040902.t1